MIRGLLGLDFGSCALKAALYEGGRITRLFEEPMPDQLVRDGAVTSPEAMATFLQDFLKANHIAARRAAVILPSSRVFVQQTELPLMTEAQLRLNLPYEFRDFITAERDKFVYDYAVAGMVRDANGNATAMRLLTAAAPKDLVYNYDSLCRWAGLKLTAAIPVEMAYINLIRRFVPGDEKERCFVDLGHAGLRSYFFAGDRFEAVSTGERGGAAIDDLLAEQLQNDVHIAHVGKHTNLQGEQSLPEVRALLQELLRDVQRAVNFYEFSNPDHQVSECYLCGGGSRMEGVREELEQMLPAFRVHSMAALLPGVSEDDGLTASCASAIGAAVGEGGRA